MRQTPNPEVLAMLIDQMMDEPLLIFEAIAAEVAKELTLNPCQTNSVDHTLLALLFVPGGQLAILLELFTVGAEPTPVHDGILQLPLSGLLVYRSIPH